MTTRPRIVSWFSGGDASAVCARIILNEHPDSEIVVARCLVPEEHPDTERFAADCENWWRRKIINLRSREYETCEDVWRRRRYMAGIRGAPCTTEMKKAVRWEFEQSWGPDYQAFGFTAEEKPRAERFRAQNPEVRLLTPLIDHGLTKADCHAMVAGAGIMLPAMYRLGFNNNNCIGCVKATSPTYWNRVRRLFPDVFGARAKLSRELGVRLVRTTRAPRRRLFLDELDPMMGWGDAEPALDCGLLCDTQLHDSE